MSSSKRWNVIGALALTGLLLWVTNSAYADADALDQGNPYPGPTTSIAPVDLSVRAGKLQLDPDPVNGGYVGSLPIKIAYRGPSGNSFSARVEWPVGLRVEWSRDSWVVGPCGSGDHYADCPMNALADGEHRTITVKFRSLAAPTEKARYTEYAKVSVAVSNGSQSVPIRHQADATSRYRGKLTGTGRGTDKRTYRPAAEPDAALTVVGTPTTDHNGDGSWTTHVPLQITANNDALHEGIMLKLIEPVTDPWKFQITTPGYMLPNTDPFGAPAGDALPQGKTRLVSVDITTLAAPAAGSTVKIAVQEYGNGHNLTDRDPSNNVVTVNR
jgi:hypothetical protein